MKLKCLIPPLILSALALSGCASLSLNKAEEKSNTEILDELAFDWFEKVSGVSERELNPTPDSELYAKNTRLLGVSYRPAVESQIKKSLQALYSNIPDTNFESRRQVPYGYACVSAEFLRKGVEKSLPFLITPNKATSSQRELMRQIINTMGEGYEKVREISSNVFTLGESSQEFYYRAAIKLAYIMHHPEFASGIKVDGTINCMDLENLFVPLAIASKMEADMKSAEAYSSYRKSSLNWLVQNAVAFSEQKDLLHIIFAGRKLHEKPIFRAKSGRIYAMKCEALEKISDLEIEGTVTSDLYTILKSEFNTRRSKAFVLLDRNNVEATYNQVNNFQYNGYNQPYLYDNWKELSAGWTPKIKVLHCTASKSLL